MDPLKKLERLLECPICFDILNTPVIIPQCSHNFCSLCIRRHLGMANQCPLCLKEVFEIHLKPNRIVEEVISQFKCLRDTASKGGYTTPSKSSNLITTPPKLIRKHIQIISNDTVSKLNRAKEKFYEKKAESKIRVEEKFHERKADNKRKEEMHCGSKVIPSNSHSDRLPPLFDDILICDIPTVLSNVELDPSAVYCPVCGKSMKASAINVHLDKCLSAGTKSVVRSGGSSSNMSSSVSRQSSSNTQPIPSSSGTNSTIPSSSGRSSIKNNRRQPMPKLVYELMKDTELRRKLKECGLSTSGNRKTLVKRHREFAMLFNAECDKAEPRPLWDLIRETEHIEKAIAASKIKTVNISNKTSKEELEKQKKKYLEDNGPQYNKLIQDVKRRMEGDKDSSDDDVNKKSSIKRMKRQMFLSSSDEEDDDDINITFEGVMVQGSKDSNNVTPSALKKKNNSPSTSASDDSDIEFLPYTKTLNDVSDALKQYDDGLYLIDDNVALPSTSTLVKGVQSSPTSPMYKGHPSTTSSPIDKGHSSTTSPMDKGHSSGTSPMDKGHSSTTSPMDKGHSSGTSPMDKGHSSGTSPMDKGHSSGTSPMDKGHSSGTSPMDKGHSSGTSPMDKGHSSGTSPVYKSNMTSASPIDKMGGSSTNLMDKGDEVSTPTIFKSKRKRKIQDDYEITLRKVSKELVPLPSKGSGITKKMFYMGSESDDGTSTLGELCPDESSSNSSSSSKENFALSHMNRDSREKANRHVMILGDISDSDDDMFVVSKKDDSIQADCSESRRSSRRLVKPPDRYEC